MTTPAGGSGSSPRSGVRRADAGGPWLPTATHVRAVVAAVGLGLLAVIAHRPDLAVLATPFLVVATWGALMRPTGIPHTRLDGTDVTLLETQPVTVRAVTSGLTGAETVGHELGVGPGILVRPAGAAARVDGDENTTAFTVLPQRWGPSELGLGELHARSAWSAFDSRWRRWGGLRVSIGPSVGAFHADGPVPHPSTLLGLHHARRRGDGAEFNDIREFRPGDRPRHVHWPTSARTGRLHVRTTYAENDTEVVLLVDALGDVPGRPDGSLTRTVRAAASVAAWCTRNGDRVGLRILGADVLPVPSGTGQRQLLRILGTLAQIEPGSDRFADDLRLRLTLAPGSLLVVLTPLTASTVAQTAVARHATGVDVIVVDTAPEVFAPAEADEDIAWRVLELERDRTRLALAREGIAVTPWRGPGTLDAVLLAWAGRTAGAR